MYMFHRLLSLVTMMYNEQDQLTMCLLELSKVCWVVFGGRSRSSGASEATLCGRSNGVRCNGIAANAVRRTPRFEAEVPLGFYTIFSYKRGQYGEFSLGHVCFRSSSW